MRLQEVGSDLPGSSPSLEADPARSDEVEARLDLIAEARRRFRAQTLEELLGRREEARRTLEAVAGNLDPVAVAAAEVDRAEHRYDALASETGAARRDASAAFAAAVAEELQGVGMGEGEFVVELRERIQGRQAATRLAS